jgi:hypothetical protein
MKMSSAVQIESSLLDDGLDAALRDDAWLGVIYVKVSYHLSEVWLEVCTGLYEAEEKVGGLFVAPYCLRSHGRQELSNRLAGIFSLINRKLSIKPKSSQS